MMRPASPALTFGRMQDPYPGTGLQVTKGEYESFRSALRAMEVKLKHDKDTLGRFNPTAGITLPAANPDLATLADEFLHAWNHHHERGKYLDSEAARWHREIYQMAVELFKRKGKGTSGLPDGFERTFHQLEALNYLCSPLYKPRFLERIENDLLRWALAWKATLPGGA